MLETFSPCVGGAANRGSISQADPECELRERIRFLGSAGQVEYARRLGDILLALRATKLFERDREMLVAILNTQTPGLGQG